MEQPTSPASAASLAMLGPPPLEDLSRGTEGLQTPRWSKPDSNSRSHPLTRRQTHGSDRMNGAERDTVVGSGSLVTLDPGAAKREIARSFPVRPWALSQARGA